VKRKYRVLLAVDIDGRIYGVGETVELDDQTATDYNHALVAVEEEEKSGGNN
jgi:hypothetical protein